MTTKLHNAIEALAEKAAACTTEPGPNVTTPAAAMQFSQAALNLANTARAMQDAGLVRPFDEQAIDRMVSRFLQWKLPADFSPDGGISFTPDFDYGTGGHGRHEPVGTNLFTAAQAKEMIRHLIAD